jgi:hypothetical protein
MLRIVLVLVARQQAAGINPALSQVPEHRIAPNAALTDAEVLRLHAQHIVHGETFGPKSGLPRKGAPESDAGGGEYNGAKKPIRDGRW